MTELLAAAVILLAGVYLVALAGVSFLAPERASHFLLGFAGSALAHYVELLVRLVVGGAFLLYAPHMPFSSAFVAFGWLLVITTAGLFVVPWRRHHHFAQRSVPHAIRHLKLVGSASLAFGAVILAAVFRGAA